MANTVNVTVLENGPRNALVHVYLRSDGSTGELVNVTLIDPFALVTSGTPGALGMEKNARLLLGRIEYNYAGFDSVLSFGSGTVPPNYKWVLTQGANCPVDFTRFTNLFDNSGLDGTECLNITTTGFNNTACQGSMLIQVIK